MENSIQNQIFQATYTLTSNYIDSLKNNDPNFNIYIVHFKTNSEISKLYNIYVDCVCEYGKNSSLLDVEKLVSEEIILSVIRNIDGKTEAENITSGYASNIKELGSYVLNSGSGIEKTFIFYHLELHPAMWKYSQVVDSKVFVQKNIEEIVKELIKFNDKDQWVYIPSEFKLGNEFSNKKRDFIMQYNENKFDFFCWLLEQNGIYFYFDDYFDNGKMIPNKLIISDGSFPNPSLENYNSKNPAEPFLYNSANGFNIDQPVITSFMLKQAPTPKTVKVIGYNYMKPNMQVSGEYKLNSNLGFGQIILSNEDVGTVADAETIAKIRAQEIYCHSRVFCGVSNIYTFTPGLTFKMQGHFNNSFNYSDNNKTEYLLTKVIHEGCFVNSVSRKTAIDINIFKQYFSLDNDSDYYHNDFECIKVDVNYPYRPKRIAPRAKIEGSINAFIAGRNGDDKDGLPETDELGRYKIKFYFDQDSSATNKASYWVRRAQEFVGKNFGSQSSLSAGIEVLVNFIKGNPNQPVIVGALYNEEVRPLKGKNNEGELESGSATGSFLKIGNPGISLGTSQGAGSALVDNKFLGSIYDVYSDKRIQTASTFDTSITGLQSSINSLFKNKTATYGISLNGKNGIPIGVLLAILGVAGGISIGVNAGGMRDTIANMLGIGKTDKEIDASNSGAPSTSITSIVKAAIMQVLSIKNNTKYAAYSQNLISSTGQTSHLQQSLPNSYMEAISALIAMVAINVAGDRINYVKHNSDMRKIEEQQKIQIDTYNAEIANLEKLKNKATQKIEQTNLKNQIDFLKSKINSLKKFKEGAKNKFKGEMIQDIITKNLPTLLMILKTKFNRKNYSLGGILLNAQDSNINLVARDPISLHSVRGIFNNTEDLDLKVGKGFEEEYLNFNDSGVAKVATADNGTTAGHTFAAYHADEEISNGEKGLAYIGWGSEKGNDNYKFPMLKNGAAVLHWGKTYKEGQLPGDYTAGKSNTFVEDPDGDKHTLTGFLQKRIKTYSDFSAVSFKYKYDTDDLENHKVMQKRFIANQTEHIINVARYGTDLFKGQKYSVAYSYTFVTKALDSTNKQKNLTFLRMSSKSDEAILKVDDSNAYQPSKTGFIVDVFGAAANDHSITLRAHSEEKTTIDNTNYKKPSSWLNLSKDVAELSVAKDEKQKQMIKATNGAILLGLTTENKPEVDGTKIKSGAVIATENLTIKCQKHTIEIGENGITIKTDGKTTTLEEIEFKKKKVDKVEEIKGVGNLKIDGGIIKIG